MFKKVRPARPQPFWLRGAYLGANAVKSGKSVSPKVGKMARTPLAAFFNIP
jgi:hypothetical protein